VEVKIIILAIAGAMIGRTVKITNIPSWPVSISQDLLFIILNIAVTLEK